MSRWKRLLLATTVTAAIAAAELRADDTTLEAAPAKAVAELIKQLDSEEFAQRQEASTKLGEMGAEVIPALGEVAQGDSAEASTRALEILRKHYESSDAALREAAKTTLKKIADNDQGPASRRAAEILTPKTKPGGVTPATPLAPGGIRLGGAGGIRMEMRAIGGPGLRRISIKTVDGVKEIEAQEAERTVKISDHPEKGIQVKVTEKKDGKDETKEYEAKNAEELKTKHPEAHKFYEQYAGKGGGIRIDAPAILPGGAIPGFAPAFPAPILPEPARLARPIIIRDAGEMAERFEKAQKDLEAAADRLKKLAEGSENKEELSKAIESLEQSRKELAELKGKLVP